MLFDCRLISCTLILKSYNRRSKQDGPIWHRCKNQQATNVLGQNNRARQPSQLSAYVAFVRLLVYEILSLFCVFLCFIIMDVKN